jgi:hypothetical protein
MGAVAEEGAGRAVAQTGAGVNLALGASQQPTGTGMVLNRAEELKVRLTNTESVKQAVVLREVLGPPKAFQF